MNIYLKGEIGDSQSWGISTIGNVQGFLANNQNVTIHPMNQYGEVPHNVFSCLRTQYESYDVFIRQGLAEHMDELQHVPKPIKRISLSCWDSDLITENSANIHNLYADGVLALSHFTKKAFQDAGVKVPIHVGGQGVDTDLFFPAKKKDKDTFDFLFVGVAQGRKGTQEVISAFEDVFGDNKKVRLLVKSNSWGKLKDYSINCDNIIPMYVEYTRKQLAELYRNSDCFVLATHGDSFMLPGIEALASGLPLIITDFGGPRDYCNNQTGYPLKYELKEAGYLPGHQAKPDYEHLKELLYHVYTHQDEAREKGLYGASWCREYWTWKKDAERIINFFNTIPNRG